MIKTRGMPTPSPTPRPTFKAVDVVFESLCGVGDEVESGLVATPEVGPELEVAVGVAVEDEVAAEIVLVLDTEVVDVEADVEVDELCTLDTDDDDGVGSSVILNKEEEMIKPSVGKRMKPNVLP